MLNRTITPEIKDAINFSLHLKDAQHYTLNNGLPVYCINAGEQEVIQLELVFFAGNWFEEKNIVAATTNFLLKNGTSTKSAFEINEHFDYFGAYLNRNCYNETATISLHCLSKHIKTLLPVINELISDSVFSEKELAIYKQNQIQRLRVNLQKCDFVANRHIDEYIYGIDHPYGKYTTIADYEALTREDLLSFYNTYYLNGKCLIFASGKLPEDLISVLNSAFGSRQIHQHSNLDKVINYIMNQKMHHKKKTFKEEYIAFLRKFEVEYKEEYLFDWID